MPSPYDGVVGQAVVSLLREATASGAPVVSLVRSSSALGKRTRDLSDEFILGGIFGAAAVALGGAAWMLSSKKARRAEAPPALRCDVSRKDVMDWYALLEAKYAEKSTAHAFLSALKGRTERYTLDTAVSTYDDCRKKLRDQAWKSLGIDPILGEEYRTRALHADASSALQLENHGANICSPLEMAAVRLGAMRASCQQYAILGGCAEYEKFSAEKLESEKLQAQAVADMEREIAEAISDKCIDTLRKQVKYGYRRVRKSKPKRLDQNMCGEELIKAQGATLRWLGELSKTDQIDYFRAEAFLTWERGEK